MDDGEKKRVELERERKKGADSYITEREYGFFLQF